MARAKSTDRAAARRRHRALVADEAIAGETGSGTVSGAAPTAPAPRRAAVPVAGDRLPPRLGPIAAFRSSVGNPHYREDLAAMPGIARNTKALWVPAALVLFATVVSMTGDFLHNGLVSLVFNIGLVPPPLVMSFLAGMLTTRASYLAGGVIGLLSALGYGLVVATTSVETTTGALTGDQRLSLIAQGLIVSTIGGAMGGAFAGFYRRFLSLSSPQRPQRRPATRPGSKPAAPRR